VTDIARPDLHVLDLPKGPVPTVAEFVDDWLEMQQHLRASTRATYASWYRTHIEPLLGDLPVSSVGDAEAREFVSALQARVGRSTATNILGFVRAALDEACVHGHLLRNPTRSLPRRMRPGRTAPPRRILTNTEVHTLLAAAPHVWERTLYASCIYAGLRSGEARGLRWCDVDFDADRIRVRQQALRDGELGPLKTNSSERDIVLYPQLADALAAHRTEAQANERDLVFATRDGATIKRCTFRRHLDVTVERAAIRHTTPHDLRRTFGSILIAAGADITYVQRQMGHSSPAVTLNCYAGLFDEQRNVDTVTAYLNQTAPPAA
jgi:integrase